MPLKRSHKSSELFASDSECLLDAESQFIPLAHLEVPWKNKKYPESRYSFVEVIPKTGRFHQIRRHASHLGHPIVGDTKHGNGDHNQLWRRHLNCNRLLLHAASLEFTHPLSGLSVVCKAELPESFAVALTQLPWRYL